MSRRVYFARINRRLDAALADELGERRSFREDMETLADAHTTRYSEITRTWIAADMEITPAEEYLYGVLGYEQPEDRRTFNEDAFSWLKGDTWTAEGAPERAVVPFAVDLREDRRWVAYATNTKMRSREFIKGFRLALNAAVGELGLWPTDWDVDEITSKGQVVDWVRQHPDVFEITVTIKLPNPTKNLQGVYDKMAKFAASRKTEEYRAAYASELNVLNQDGEPTAIFDETITGVEDGNVTVKMKARGEGEVREVPYSSEEAPDYRTVPDWDDDREGIERVLQELAAYSAERAGEVPPAGVSVLPFDGEEEGGPQ